MSRQDTIDWERRFRTPAAIAAVATPILMIVSLAVGSSDAVRTETELLRDFSENSGTELIAAILLAFAFATAAGALYFLFSAAANRSPSVRRGFVGVIVAAPLFLGVGGIFDWLALDAAATDFATGGGGAGIPVGEYAEDLREDQWAFSLAQGLNLAGTLGLVFGLIYTPLWAMRTGLVTRFFGTLGMALGAGLVLIPGAFIGLMLWMLWLGLLFADRVPRGRPPAWDAGEAIPWPRPGEQEDEPPDRDDDEIEGDAHELMAGDGENPHAARRERAKRRKRKRRG